MINKRGQPISGGAGNWQRSGNVLTHAADTSADAQKIVSGSPNQYASPYSTVNVAAPTNASNRANPNFAKDAMRFGGVPRPNGIRQMADPNFADVGYKAGATKAKPGNPIISGYPTRGGRQVAGEINLPKGVKVKRFKTNNDIFSPRVLHEAGLSRL